MPTVKCLLERLAGAAAMASTLHATVVIATPSGEVQIVDGDVGRSSENVEARVWIYPIFLFPALGRAIAELGNGGKPV
jgi:hypothetical protein